MLPHIPFRFENSQKSQKEALSPERRAPPAKPQFSLFVRSIWKFSWTLRGGAPPLTRPTRTRVSIRYTSQNVNLSLFSFFSLAQLASRIYSMFLYQGFTFSIFRCFHYGMLRINLVPLYISTRLSFFFFQLLGFSVYSIERQILGFCNCGVYAGWRRIYMLLFVQITDWCSIFGLPLLFPIVSECIFS